MRCVPKLGLPQDNMRLDLKADFCYISLLGLFARHGRVLQDFRSGMAYRRVGDSGTTLVSGALLLPGCSPRLLKRTEQAVELVCQLVAGVEIDHRPCLLMRFLDLH